MLKFRSRRFKVSMEIDAALMADVWDAIDDANRTLSKRGGRVLPAASIREIKEKRHVHR